MANYQNTPSNCQISILAPQRGLSVIFHTNSANQRRDSEVRGLLQMATPCGDQIATQSGVENTSCRHGDIGKPNGDLGAKWG